MTETIQFNKGTIDVGKHEILWEIPTSEIQCISTNELNYTKEQNHFSIPVNKIDFDKESLIFTWNISEEYKPIISVKKEDFWFQLKTAESLLTAIKYFQDNNELYTIYDQANFYVDRNFAVKVLITTKETHLPHHKDANEHIDHIKNMLVELLSKSPKNSDFIDQIEQSNDINHLKQIVDDQYNLFLSTLDEQTKNSANLIKRTKIKYILVSTVMIVGAFLVTYFLLGDKEDIDILHAENETLTGKLDLTERQVTSYNAYFSGDTEEALKIANDLQENDEDAVTFNKEYYMNLLIETGEIEQALEQFPKESHTISEQFVLNAETDEILSIQTDNPYINFEQAVFMGEDIDEIISQLNELTDRQKGIVFEHFKDNDIDQAIAFANEHRNLNWLIDSLETKKEMLEKDAAKLKKKKDKEKRKEINNQIKEISEQLDSLK